jgi:nucleolar protein 14
MCVVFLLAPETCEELKSLLSGRSVEEQLLVVERIQKCNHPSLAEGNKANLEVCRLAH